MIDINLIKYISNISFFILKSRLYNVAFVVSYGSNSPYILSRSLNISWVVMYRFVVFIYRVLITLNTPSLQ